MFKMSFVLFFEYGFEGKWVSKKGQLSQKKPLKIQNFINGHSWEKRAMEPYVFGKMFTLNN